MEKSVYIIVINWNGWKDTIECLESIQLLSYKNYHIVLVDNGSKDDSLEKIKSWAVGNVIVKSKFISSFSNNKNISIVEYDKQTAEDGGTPIYKSEKLKNSYQNRLVIISNNENLGFAGGCNVGIRYALTSGADYIWLLNNDTVVDSESLLFLVKYLELNSDFKCVTGKICYYDNPSKIWNCGGKLTWYGARRYCHANHSVKSIPQNGSIKITFVTGCAALFRASLFREVGLLSELFFFGEEDFEFSLRLKKFNIKMACVYNAIIYHKVGATIGPINRKRTLYSVYIYYINRFINMRNYMTPVFWHLWRLMYSFYIIPMLFFKYKIRLILILNILIDIHRDSMKLKKVDKKTFESCMGINVK